ncbi:DUF2254 domain-containing protein [Humibacillus xanthopallidus]|uniref:Putative membrane protein n=1 Tax=Humibacillus xanthopallidus TaxID=412689 RepID=A0A543HUD2_9MICO|nr:DUF2254 domain-containing protein [Humibacillus xanthopallidus]TQM61963.1 putative membrane protein [Humibacillus xanthopallidus]
MILRLHRLRLWWETAFWVIPFAGIVVAFVMAVVTGQLDDSLRDVGLTLVSPSSAQTLLAAIGGGMVTFTGFVFSVILLVIQYGSSAYSPRTVTYFMRARTTRWALASFLGTITFSFVALVDIGSAGTETFVPVMSVVLAVTALLISMVWFLALISTVARRIKVDFLCSDIGRMARVQLRRRHAGAVAHSGEVLLSLPQPPEGAVAARQVGRSGQLVGVDVARLRRLAERTGARVDLLVGVGDGITVGAPIALVTRGQDTPTERELSRCLLVHPERSLKYDPLYALRLLIDVALRALSPSVNDPTTAVRALDEVEGVLLEAAGLDLGPIRLASSAGDGVVLLRSATWPDVVDLALTEVVEAGLSSPQVTRRLSALFTDLRAEVTADRRPPLERHHRRLVDEIARKPGADPEIWLTGDRQGLGGSR